MQGVRVIAVCLLSGAGIAAHAAEELYLFDSQAACQAWERSGHTLEGITQLPEMEGALALFSKGMFALEYSCSFEPALDLMVETPTITTHVGHCLEPGFVTPGLFTFSVDRVYDHNVTLFDGSETPTVFYFCGE